MNELRLGQKVKFTRYNKIGILATEKPDKYGCYNIVENERVWGVPKKDITHIFQKPRITINIKVNGKIKSYVSFLKEYLDRPKLNILGLAIKRILCEIKSKNIPLDTIEKIETIREDEKWIKI